jgi:hypothetical protein
VFAVRVDSLFRPVQVQRKRNNLVSLDSTLTSIEYHHQESKPGDDRSEDGQKLNAFCIPFRSQKAVGGEVREKNSGAPMTEGFKNPLELHDIRTGFHEPSIQEWIPRKGGA